jgi:diguanylate cyclase (GGDEF)-like protein/PAS domain S-box-containing protein
VQNENHTDEFRSALAQLQFLKGSLRQVFAWPLACMLAGFLVWGFALSYAASEKARIGAQALDDAAALAASYAGQLARTVEQLDQTTLALAYYWKQGAGRLRLQDQAGQGLYPDVAEYSVAIFGKDGKLLTSLRGNQGRVDISDRPYFQAHKKQLISGLQATRLEKGRIVGTPVVVFSRALIDEAGQFDGLVCVTVPPSFLASFYEQAAAGENNALALVTRTGEVIVSKMGKNVGSRQALVNGAAVFPVRKGKMLVPAERFNDSRPRLVAWETLDKYPLVSVVALADEDIYQPYEAIRRNTMGMATAATLLLLLAGVVGGALCGRLVWRKHQAAVIADTYRLAIEGAREGFFMARALYGQGRAVTDFVVENCNEQGARMIGFSRDDLIEVRFSQIYTGRAFEKVKTTFRKAMENGFHEDEFAQQGQDGGRVWIHRRLVRSGDGIAITLRDISEAKAHQSALESLGNTDALTGLRNRYWLGQYLPEALARAQQAKSSLAVLYLDLDDFKDVNNTMGHDAGDHVLRQAGQRIVSALRPGDHVVRLGGDEFTVLLTGADRREEVVAVAARILDGMAAPFQVRGGQQPRVGASIGISLYPDDGQTTEALLQHADTAMYAAKNQGKGRYAFYTPALTEQIVHRIRNEYALRRAIEVNEFVLHYQPRVNAVSGELLSMEALVRWMHPERGMVPPLEFIGLAEDTGLIVELGKLVIDQACMQLAAWQGQGLRVVPLSVNVSPVQFAQCDLKAVIAECLARHRIAPLLLEVEVTESCMMQDSEKVAQEIAAIKSLGVRISVDDFGTGYSSLSQLQRLDLDVLKVDRAFTQALNDGKQGRAFFMTIVSMAHILDMQVVAEGVETLEQLTMLQSLGCNEVQGYFISRPVPEALAAVFLGRRCLFPDSVPGRHAA